MATRSCPSRRARAPTFGTSGVWAVGGLAAASASAARRCRSPRTVRATGVLQQHRDADGLDARRPRRGQRQRHGHRESDLSGIALTTMDRWSASVARSTARSRFLRRRRPAASPSRSPATRPGSRRCPATSRSTRDRPAARFTVTGVTPGDTTITGTAPRLRGRQRHVTVTSSVISLGALPTLGLGQTASLPISLSTAAPAGGVTVTLHQQQPERRDGDAGASSIPAGRRVPAANPQVTGGRRRLAPRSTRPPSASPPTTARRTWSVNVTFTPRPFSVVADTTKQHHRDHRRRRRRATASTLRPPPRTRTWPRWSRRSPSRPARPRCRPSSPAYGGAHHAAGERHRGDFLPRPSP